MPRILTVDDSRAVRTIVTKELLAQKFEVDEAENGAQALEKLEEIEVDLILLDVTMPVMDGPAMLAKLRESGRKTPVIMLTSESKRSIVSEAMRLGIDDYILKPFKPEELLKKVRASLKLEATANPVTAAPTGEETSAVEPTSGKQFIDVLVIDDMENVSKRLRALLPAHLTLNGQTSAQSALAVCRDRVFRTILIDVSMPDVDSAALAGQIKLLQPHAALLGLTLRSSNNIVKELRAQGFADAVFKPFTSEAVEDFVMQYFDTQELLTRDDNLLKLAPFTGKEDKVERYFQRIRPLLTASVEQIASACFEDAILDLTGLPPQLERLPKLLLELTDEARALGIELRLVGGQTIQRTLATFEETKALPLFPTVEQAKAA